MEMNKKLITIKMILAVFACSASAQTVTLAHWDFRDGDTDAMMPEENGINCITASNVNTNVDGVSYSTKDSEDGSIRGANCFGGWGDDDSVNFGLTFDSLVEANVEQVNFDVANYGIYNGNLRPINQISLRVFRNGEEITDPKQFIKSIENGDDPNPWVSTSDTTFDVSKLGITSALGRTDFYDFRIYVSDSDYQSNTRIALDNFRVIGTHNCTPVPEPTSACLLGLATFAITLRRRR